MESFFFFHRSGKARMVHLWQGWKLDVCCLEIAWQQVCSPLTRAHTSSATGVRDEECMPSRALERRGRWRVLGFHSASRFMAFKVVQKMGLGFFVKQFCEPVSSGSWKSHFLKNGLISGIHQRVYFLCIWCYLVSFYKGHDAILEGRYGTFFKHSVRQEAIKHHSVIECASTEAQPLDLQTACPLSGSPQTCQAGSSVLGTVLGASVVLNLWTVEVLIDGPRKSLQPGLRAWFLYWLHKQFKEHCSFSLRCLHMTRKGRRKIKLFCTLSRWFYYSSHTADICI